MYVRVVLKCFLSGCQRPEANLFSPFIHLLSTLYSAVELVDLLKAGSFSLIESPQWP